MPTLPHILHMLERDHWRMLEHCNFTPFHAISRHYYRKYIEIEFLKIFYLRKYWTSNAIFVQICWIMILLNSKTPHWVFLLKERSSEVIHSKSIYSKFFYNHGKIKRVLWKWHFQKEQNNVYKAFSPVQL